MILSWCSWADARPQVINDGSFRKTHRAKQYIFNRLGVALMRPQTGGRFHHSRRRGVTDGAT